MPDAHHEAGAGSMSGDQRIFAEWQPQYAQHGVATFPVQIIGNDKRPCTKGYLRTGLRGSAQLALKFAEARSFGFACGPRNRLTIVDMDDTDPAIIGEGERLFGCSPLLWRTGGGKFAMPFRHNGEGRRIRPIKSLPIDLLGAGFVVAPPSAGAIRAYEIIEGTLADLDRLPVASIPDEIALLLPAKDRIELIPKGQRNNELFNYCRGVVNHCDSIDQLIDAAMTWADDRLAAPLAPAEIIKTSNSVWQYRGGRKRVMNHIVEAPEYDALVANVGALALFAYLSAENGPGADFMIADGLSKARGWPRRFVPTAREALLELGLVELIRAAGKNAPSLYRWKI
jgi:hypothetical protein